MYQRHNLTPKALIASTLLLTLPVSQLRAADDKTISYYLPQAVVIAKFEVRKKVWHPARFADVTPHFFPMAVAADSSSNQEDVPPNVFIKTGKTRYLLGTPTLSISALPDPARLISVKAKGVLKDISTTLAFDDEGLLTTLKYTEKDRKWDFLLRVLTTAAKVAISAVGVPFNVSSIAKASPGEKNLMLALGQGADSPPATLANECPYVQEMTPAERDVFWSNELRPLLRMPYCLLPPEFRRPLRELNASDGAGIAAFASYFAEQLNRTCSSIPCNGPNPFRPSAGSAKPNYIREFFEVWQLVDELERIQKAHLAALSNYSQLPVSGESYRIALGERDKRLEFIGEQLFGFTSTASYWSGEFRIILPDKDPTKQSAVTLFRFSVQPTSGPAVLEPAPGPAQVGDDKTKVRAMAPWPAVNTPVIQKEYTEVTLLPKGLLAPTGEDCDPTEEHYISRIPVRCELQLRNAGTTLLIQDAKMSQGGACKQHAARNGGLDISLDPRTGEARSISIARNSTLTPELAGQIDGLAGLISGAIATSRANDEKTNERNLQQKVLEKLAEACQKDPMNTNCVAFINRK